MNHLIEKLKHQFAEKKILIVGLGLQGGGVGLAKFFADLGAKVKVTDLKPKEKLDLSIYRLIEFEVKYTLGKHVLQDFLEADVIFKGPSVPWDLSELVEAQKRKIPVEMESAFFAGLCPAPIIGITGTRGKSTTTMMIYELLKKHSNKMVHLAGNLPNISTINLLSSIHQDHLVLMELSSWQLSGFHRKKISPHIAVFTNLYPDHLNLYPSMDEYLYDKKAIYLYQKKDDYVIINKELKKIISEDKPKSKIDFYDSSAFPQPLLHLKGVHNLENAAAALTIAKILNFNLYQCIDTLIHFKGLAYRQEIVTAKGGIIFVNDTTSTTPTSTIKALETFSDKPTILILGGNSKNLPTNSLINRLIEAKKIILLKGSFTDEILPTLKKRYPNKIIGPYDNLEIAVKTAYEDAKILTTNYKLQTVIILFSPGATSFAMFNNEFHRGDEFNRIVKILTHEKTEITQTL